MGETLTDSDAVGEDVLFHSSQGNGPELVSPTPITFLHPTQEYFSAGAQPGACMADMQRARKGLEGTVDPEPGTASLIIFPV